MSTTVQGKILKVFDTHQVSDKFRKREFVVITDDQYPQKIIMQMTQDKCEMLDWVTEDEKVTCHINIRGRDWTSPQGEVKYFNTLECWKIDSEAPTQSAPAKQTTTAQPASVPASEVPNDDLPF